MPTGDAEAPTEAPDVAAEPAPVLSRAARRTRLRSTRFLAVVSLLVAIGVTAYVIREGIEPAGPSPLEEASAPAWAATGALSDDLRELRRGATRTAARARAKAAAEAVDTAIEDVTALNLETSEAPVRVRVLRALRADARWIDAVGSTLANPRSPRRARLSRLAEAAAEATAVVATSLTDATGTVGGTGRLLAATRRA